MKRAIVLVLGAAAGAAIFVMACFPLGAPCSAPCGVDEDAARAASKDAYERAINDCVDAGTSRAAVDACRAAVRADAGLPAWEGGSR